MADLFIHTIVTYLIFVGMMSGYGAGNDDIAFREKVILSAPYPDFDEKDFTNTYGALGYMLSALDYGGYLIILAGAVIAKVIAMGSMIFALTSYANELFMGFPLFTIINMIYMVIITVGFIRMVKGLG